MICKACGQDISESAQFCGYCGAKVEKEPVRTKRFCTTCGAELAEGVRFCSTCGARTGEAESETVVSSSSDDKRKNSGQLLTTLKMVSLYDGEPSVGIAKASGVLSIYDDRIEFKKQLGNAAAGALGLFGMSLARSSAKKDPLIILPLSQVSEVRTGKYAAVYNTLVVALRDGSVLSFCPAIPASSEPQTIVTCLKPYLY